MISLGTIRPGSVIYIPFETFAGSTGAPITLTGLATSDILVYKDGGTTQRASASGYTLLDTDGIDFDALTGIHGISISLADNTTAGFWTAGSRYFVVIGDVTVDSQTMRFLAAEFTIGYPGALLDTTIATLATQTSFTLTAGPAEDDALNGCLVIIHDIASAVQMGLGIVSDYTGASRTVTLAAGVTFTAAAGDNISIMAPPVQASVTAQVTTIASDLVQVYSDTTAIHTQATTIASDLVQVYSDTTAIHSDTTAIHTQTTTIASDLVIIASDLLQVYSDTTIIYSDTTRIHSDTTAIEAAGGGLTATQDSRLTRVWSDVIIVGSDLLQVYSDTTIIYSDTTLISSQTTRVLSDTTAMHAQTTTIASDLVIVASDLLQVYSDTTIIYSDTTAMSAQTTTIASDVALIETTRAEPGQGSPGATLGVFTKIDYLYKWQRNKMDQNSTVQNLYADDGTTIDQKRSVSESGGTVTLGEVATGP